MLYLFEALFQFFIYLLNDSVALFPSWAVSSIKAGSMSGFAHYCITNTWLNTWCLIASFKYLLKATRKDIYHTLSPYSFSLKFLFFLLLLTVQSRCLILGSTVLVSCSLNYCVIHLRSWANIISVSTVLGNTLLFGGAKIEKTWSVTQSSP